MLCGCVRANQMNGKAENTQNRNPTFTGRKKKSVHTQLAVKKV